LSTLSASAATPGLLELPCAHGGTVGEGRIRVAPEDFIVREWLGFEPDGEGDHWLLRVRKRDANTHWVVKQLSRLSKIHQRDIGFAGLKDRHALAEQSFTLPVRSAIGSDWVGVSGEGFEVIAAQRHRRKLKRGALRGNDFEIVIREFAGAAEVLAQRIDAIAALGVPNYFGPQRFGNNGSNLVRARQWFSGEYEIHDRVQRGFALSAARAAIFNAMLAHRVMEQSWNRLQAGDVASLDGSNSIFAVDQVDDVLIERCVQMDIHPSGPLWGRGAPATQGAIADLERQIASSQAPLGEGLANAGLDQERRPLRLRVGNLQCSHTDGNIKLQFRLPRGSFATAVLHELIANVGPAVLEAEEE
jgi:tRNA pseudouridine13 synthase